jgi:cytochrome c-type biogenesis protein CcmH
MTLWFLLALMTAAAIFAVLWPLARRGGYLRSGSDIAVYRDQLEEIDRDRAAGLIPDAEAEAARVEVSRRLLAADAASTATRTAKVDPVWRRRIAALVALVLLPAFAGGLYLTLGSPGQPGAPLSARVVPPAQQSIESMVAQVEAHLERNPEDGRGWEVIAPVYMRMGRFNDAVRARGNIRRILGATAEREADFGEAMVGAANGIVTADAKAAFERAAALDANDVKAQFFLGLAAEQDGKTEDAARIWRNLLARAPASAPYRPIVQQSLARVDPNAPAAPGPSADDVAAAEQLTPDQRAEMIRGMVDRLAERLKSDGSDVDGWLRLVRAYMVLGDPDKARAAAAEGRRALGADAEKRRRLDELVKGLGLEG